MNLPALYCPVDLVQGFATPETFNSGGQVYGFLFSPMIRATYGTTHTDRVLGVRSIRAVAQSYLKMLNELCLDDHLITQSHIAKIDCAKKRADRIGN